MTSQQHSFEMSTFMVDEGRVNNYPARRDGKRHQQLRGCTLFIPYQPTSRYNKFKYLDLVPYILVSYYLLLIIK